MSPWKILLVKHGIKELADKGIIPEPWVGSGFYHYISYNASYIAKQFQVNIRLFVQIEINRREKNAFSTL